MPRLRADQSGQIAPVEIFKYALEILKLIHGFAKGVKKVSEKYVYVPLWKYRYIYHIHEDTRDYVYNEKNHIFNYLDTEDVLKKFGFIFGNEKAVVFTRKLIHQIRPKLPGNIRVDYENQTKVSN